MKKIFIISLTACAVFAMALSCAKEIAISDEQPATVNDQVSPSAGKEITITAHLSDLLTKVSFDPTYSGGKPTSLALAWEKGDQLRIYDHANHASYSDFTLSAGSIGQKDGTFTGTPITASSWDVEVLPAGFTPSATQTQPSDGVTSGLKYRATANEVTDLTDLKLTDLTNVLAITAKLPADNDVAGGIKSVDITASEDIFFGGNSLTITLTTPGDAGSDNILHLFANLPSGTTAIPAGTTLLVHFNAPETSHTVYTRFISFTSAEQFTANKMNTININATQSDKHAGLTSCDGSSAEKAYLIGDKYQMQEIFLTTTKKYYKMVDDIDMSGVSWTSLNAAGTGIIDFNGNNKTISNLNAPLFADLNGKVYDFTLYNSTVSSAETVGILANTCNTAESDVDGVTISGDAPSGEPLTYHSTLTSTASEGTKYVGGLVGHVSTASKFKSCHVINTKVTAPTSADYTYTGGVIGYIDKENHTEVVSNCTVESSAITGYNYVGGLIGYYSRGSVNNNKVGYDDASNEKKCTVTANGYAGGLIGYHSKGYVDNNNVFCDVSGDNRLGGLTGSMAAGEENNNSSAGDVSSTGYYTGGLIGYFGNGTINGCYATGNVTSTVTNYAHAGGLIGTASKGTVKKCYSTGTVSAVAPMTGGLIGDMTAATVKDCYAEATITMTASSATYSHTGGLVGQINGNGTITRCYSNCNITVNKQIAGVFIGKIEGESVTTSITNCYAKGSLTASGCNYIGGFIGTTESGQTVTVTNCYTKSTISGKNNYSTCVFAGNDDATTTCSGFIGWVNKPNWEYQTADAPADNYKGTGTGAGDTIKAHATSYGWDSSIWKLGASDPDDPELNPDYVEP